MKRIVLGLLISGLSLSSQANWSSTGHWEFADSVDYHKLPDVRWNKTVVLDIYSAAPSQQLEIERELSQMSKMASSANLDSVYNDLINKAHAKSNDLLKQFGLKRGAYKKTTFKEDFLSKEYMFFSHKLNSKVTGELYTYYDSYSSLTEVTFKREWLKCDKGSDSGFNYEVGCRDRIKPLIPKTTLNTIAKQFQSLYGFSPQSSSFVLYNPKIHELLVVRYRSRSNLDTATLYPINIKSGQGGTPLDITEFRY